MSVFLLSRGGWSGMVQLELGGCSSTTHGKSLTLQITSSLRDAFCSKASPEHHGLKRSLLTLFAWKNDSEPNDLQVKLH